MDEYITNWYQLWNSAKNIIWYKSSKWLNHGGDLVKWIDATDAENLRFCKAIIRREDGLIFQNTLGYRNSLLSHLKFPK